MEHALPFVALTALLTAQLPARALCATLRASELGGGELGGGALGGGALGGLAPAAVAGLVAALALVSPT